MNGINKALVIFCEGTHDVAFLSQAFRHCLGFERAALKFSQLPSPFNFLFKANVDNHAAQDLSLDMAHKFFLPDQLLKNDNKIILLFNSGGDTQSQKIITLLADLLPLLHQASVFPAEEGSYIEETNFLFTYDADEVGATRRIESIKENFSSIEEITFIEDDFQESPHSPYGFFSGKKSIYIWGETPEKGTLEDLTFPIFNEDNPELVEKLGFIDEAFDWADSVSQQSKRKKAIITCAGQKKKPGGSLSTILDQAKLIKKTTFRSNKKVTEFIRFVESHALEY